MRFLLMILCIVAFPAMAQQGKPQYDDPLLGQARQLADVVAPLMNRPAGIDPSSPVMLLNGMIELVVESEDPFVVRAFMEIMIETGSGDVIVDIYQPTPVAGDIGGWSGENFQMKGYPVESQTDGLRVFFEGDEKFGQIGNVSRLDFRGVGDLSGGGMSPYVMTGPLSGEMMLGRKKFPVKGSFLSVQMQ